MWKPLSVRLSIVLPRQMPPNRHPLLPNSGWLLQPVSEGCCRVHNANIQLIPVKSNLYSLVRPSSHSGLQIATLAVCAMPNGSLTSPNGTTPHLRLCPDGKGKGPFVALSRYIESKTRNDKEELYCVKTVLGTTALHQIGTAQFFVGGGVQ